MNTRLITVLLTVTAVVAVAAGVGFTDEKPAAPMSEQEMFGKMMELAQPTAMHKTVLPRLVGTWTAAGKIYTGGGEQPIGGKSTNTAIMGGRFIHVSYSGPFMGMPFEGAAFVGFDNLSKTFQQTWIMTLATNMDVMTGSWDEESKTLTWRGKAKMPNGATYDKRSTVCFKSADVIFEESFATGPDGKENKEMELTYTRADK